MTFVVWLFRLIRKNSFRNASSYLLYSGLLLHVCVYNKLAVVTAPKVNLMTYNVGYFPKNLSLQFPSALLPFRYGDSKILLLSFFPFADVQGIPCQIEEAMLLHFGALNSERKIKPKSFLLRLPLPKLGPLPPWHHRDQPSANYTEGRHVKLARNTKTESTQTTRIFVFLFPRFAFSGRIVSTHREENKIKTDRTSTFPIGFIPFPPPPITLLNADLRSACPIRNVLRVA